MGVGMSDKIIAVIGGGIFGCTTALALDSAGYEIILLERQLDIVMSASSNNTNRIHQGFHYPRDLQTAKDCRDNYQRFESHFKDCLVERHPSIYGIAEEHSMTTKEQFLIFCDKLGLSYSIVDDRPLNMKIDSCNLNILCDEAVLNSNKIRENLHQRINNSNMNGFYNYKLLQP